MEREARTERPLLDDVAIVTGASAGIGAATARELARRGARVVLAARRVDELEAQAQAIRDAGGEAMAIPTDVADREHGSVAGLVREIALELELRVAGLAPVVEEAPAAHARRILVVPVDHPAWTVVVRD